jgi:hypothetical protein
VRTLPERLWSRVEFDPDGCWLWGGALNSKGYGVIRNKGQAHLVHRLVLILDGRLPLPGDEACHSCDTPRCVRPDHLRWGSRRENHRDMVERGRAFWQQ